MDYANPSHTASARFTASIEASSSFPNVGPIFSRGTVWTLSTMTCDLFFRLLPSVGSSLKGQKTRIQITVAEIVQVKPATGEKIYLGGDGVASKYLNIAAVIGNYAELYCDGTSFYVTAYSGVLTKEG